MFACSECVGVRPRSWNWPQSVKSVVSHVISFTRPSSTLFFPTREEGLGKRLWGVHIRKAWVRGYGGSILGVSWQIAHILGTGHKWPPCSWFTYYVIWWSLRACPQDMGTPDIMKELWLLEVLNGELEPCTPPPPPKHYVRLTILMQHAADNVCRLMWMTQAQVWYTQTSWSILSLGARVPSKKMWGGSELWSVSYSGIIMQL